MTFLSLEHPRICWHTTSKITLTSFTKMYVLGDLKTRKSTGTSCQIEIHFSSQTSKFLIKYNLLRFQISGGLIIISLLNMIAKFQQVL